VQYWTVDDEEDMRHLIEINADGIVTNYPHKLKKVCIEYFPEIENDKLQIKTAFPSLERLNFSFRLNKRLN
jgi:hypothetical protein